MPLNSRAAVGGYKIAISGNPPHCCGRGPPSDSSVMGMAGGTVSEVGLLTMIGGTA